MNSQIFKYLNLQIFTILFSIFTIQYSIAQDSIPKDTVVVKTHDIISNIDSLDRLYLIEQYKLKNNLQFTIQNSTSNIKHSDKYYSKKINEIKSLVNLTYNENVKKYIEYFLFTKRKQTEIMISISKFFLPQIQKVLNKNQIPDELKFIPVTVSSLYYNSKSSSGAYGFWHLNYTVARMNGIKINSYIDERKDLSKSTVAAVTQLKNLYKIYNDWLLVIAAYNSSPANVNKAIRRAKGSMNFWKIYPYLNSETRDYVPAFIAINYIFNFYNDENISLLPIANCLLPDSADSVVVCNLLHFHQIAKVLKIPIQQIRDMNPVYTKDIIPHSEDGLILAMPFGYGKNFYLLKDSIYKFTDSTISYLKYSFESKYPNFNKTNKQSSIADIYYIVKNGDKLNKIATKYGVSVTEIKKWNSLKSLNVRKGQKLVIHYPVQNNLPNKNPQNTSLNNPAYYYIVKPGDNLTKIAKDNNISQNELLKINKLSSSDLIKIGQKIRLK